MDPEFTRARLDAVRIAINVFESCSVLAGPDDVLGLAKQISDFAEDRSATVDTAADGGEL